MNADTLLDNFEILAEAPGGIDRLRELLLNLGASGKLLPQISAEVREEILWSVDSLRLDEHRLWGESYLENSPTKWPKIPLARLGSWGSGGTPTRGNKTYYDGEIPWLVIGDLNDGVVTSATNSITKKGLEESSAVIVPVGAVFVAMYGSIGKSGIAGFECATNQAIAHCVPDRKVISTEYLFLVIRAVKPRLFSQGRGLAQQNISQTVLKHLMISVPPLAEQKRIVAKVDELMVLCDQLEQKQKQRNNLRTATRKSAIEAISTATTPEELEAAWNRIKNYWEVIADTPESIDSLRELIHDFAVNGFTSNLAKFDEVELRELSVINYGYTDSAKSAGVGPKFLRITDIQKGAVNWNSVPYCEISKQEEERQVLESGDIVFARTGATTGKSFLLVDPPRSVCASYLIRLRVNKSRLNPDFLYLYFQSGRYWKDVREGMSGTAQGGFNSSKLGKMKILLPTLEEQLEIVRRTRELTEICDQLEAGLTTRIELAEKFARSVVSAA